MSETFKRTPTCERCRLKEAITFIQEIETKRWSFICPQCRATGPGSGPEYEVAIASFFHSPPATVDWMAHLYEKEEFDGRSFAVMFHRFREATGSFGVIADA
jgi:hypothetical protein